jgi:RNA polymerase sigma factor (sigma-70 family)
MRRLPDPELIALARAGSPDAAGALFDRYWAHAWGAAYAVTADRALAEDAAQEAIQKAFSALDRFDETRPFGPWLKRIVVNRAIDHLRRGRRLAVLNDETATLHGWALSKAPDDQPPAQPARRAQSRESGTGHGGSHGGEDVDRQAAVLRPDLRVGEGAFLHRAGLRHRPDLVHN